MCTHILPSGTVKFKPLKTTVFGAYFLYAFRMTTAGFCLVLENVLNSTSSIMTVGGSDPAKIERRVSEHF